MGAGGSDRLRVFINSLYSGNTRLLDEMESEAIAAGIPIIRKDTQSLIRTLLEASPPEKILEVGTATGFSAVFMCTYAPKAALVTIEKYEKRIPAARANFRRAGLENRITLLEGEASGILREMAEREKGLYGFIFMDAAKGQYINFLPDVMELLAPGGILLSDNVLQDGCIIESRFAVERRDRTIHARMREYLYALTHDERLTTAVLDVGDGAALSVKRKTAI